MRQTNEYIRRAIRYAGHPSMVVKLNNVIKSNIGKEVHLASLNNISSPVKLIAYYEFAFKYEDNAH